MKWIVLKQTLQFSRKWHVAIPIPDSATIPYKINDGRKQESLEKKQYGTGMCHLGNLNAGLFLCKFSTVLQFSDVGHDSND